MQVISLVDRSVADVRQCVRRFKKTTISAPLTALLRDFHGTRRVAPPERRFMVRHSGAQPFRYLGGNLCRTTVFGPLTRCHAAQ